MYFLFCFYLNNLCHGLINQVYSTLRFHVTRTIYLIAHIVQEIGEKKSRKFRYGQVDDVYFKVLSVNRMLKYPFFFPFLKRQWNWGSHRSLHAKWDIKKKSWNFCGMSPVNWCIHDTVLCYFVPMFVVSVFIGFRFFFLHYHKILLFSFFFLTIALRIFKNKFTILQRKKNSIYFEHSVCVNSVTL